MAGTCQTAVRGAVPCFAPGVKINEAVRCRNAQLAGLQGLASCPKPRPLAAWRDSPAVSAPAPEPCLSATRRDGRSLQDDGVEVMRSLYPYNRQKSSARRIVHQVFSRTVNLVHLQPHEAPQRGKPDRLQI